MELVAGIVAGVIGIIGLVWIFAGRWVSASKKGAVAKDDLKEASAVVTEQSRVMGVLAKPVPRGKKLLEMIRARRERSEGGK